MSIGIFISRALKLSISVLLRMLVMLAATVFVIALFMYALWDYPFGIFFVLVLSLFPGLVFLYLSCVRAGLVADITHVLNLLGQLPLAIILIFFFALSVSVGIIGTSSGAVGATAADQGFTLSFGGPLAPISSLSGQPPALYFGIAGYMIWAGCAVCAGKALAYVQTKLDHAAEWEQERSDMLGEAVPEGNLRELRLRRQEAQKLKTSDDSEVAEDLDEEELGEEIPEADETDIEAPKGPASEPQ